MNLQRAFFGKPFLRRGLEAFDRAQPSPQKAGVPREKITLPLAKSRRLLYNGAKERETL